MQTYLLYFIWRKIIYTLYEKDKFTIKKNKKVSNNFDKLAFIR
ncbi:MAG: hypothetical protein RL742_1622 [Bacteroidota bacterium]|jgi:hypothetical protein